MKICGKCSLPFEGYECLPCKRIRSLKYYYDNKDRFVEKRAAYRERTREHYRAARRKTYAEKIKPFRVRQQFAHKLPVGTETVRLDKHTKTGRVWVKIAEPNKWRPRAVVVYEREHGSIPRGYVVHHMDHNAMNDDPANLTILTRAEHAREHGGQFWGANAHMKLWKLAETTRK